MNPTYDYSLADNGRVPYAKISLIKDDVNVIGGGALLLPRYSKLDGRYHNTSNLQAYISSQVSDSEGNFTGNAYPAIRAVFSRPKNCSGMRMRFNSHTGDYPLGGMVRWYTAKGTLISEDVFSPTGTELYLYTEVSGFSTVEVTFYSTNRPQRPIFVEYFGFIALRAGETFKIVYDGRAPGSADNISLESDSTWEELSKEACITKATGFNLALCAPRYSKLDGRTHNRSGSQILSGWVSQEYSSEDGTFETAPVLTVSFSDGYYTSTGINLGSGWKMADIVSEIQIQWLRDGAEVATETFYPDSTKYYCAKAVDDFNGLVFTFRSTKSGYRPVILTLIELGREEEYAADQISSNETMSEISPLSEELSNNSLDFSLKGILHDMRFQKQQELSIWFDGEKQGVFYVKTGKRKSKIDYDVYAEDAISLLDETWYGFPSSYGTGYHGWFNNSLSEAVHFILKDSSIPYVVDDSIANINIRGYLPVCTRREALQQVAFAAGVIVDTFGSNTIRFVPRDYMKDPIKITKDNILACEEEDLDDVSKIVLSMHDFVLDYNNGNGYVELFNGSLEEGTHRVTFDAPCIVFSASNVEETYFNNAINMAFVTPTDAAQNAILKGYKQVDNIVKIEKVNPKFPAAFQNQNVVKVESAYFVHAGNANEVLERVYQYHQKRKRVTLELVGVDIAPGDMVTVPLYDGSEHIGMVERVTSTYSSKAYREVVVR